MATHEITLDVTKKEITPQVIHTRVGDSNTTIKATVTNDGAAYSLSGATVKFKAAKPDGTYAEQSATVSGSTATVTLAPEFLAVPGIIKTAYFEITASGKKDTTGNVWIDNRADAEGEAPDLSTSYIPTVDQLVEDATEALNSANTALGNAEEALEDAEAATDSATDAAASANAAASAAQSAIDAMTGNVLRGTVGPSEVVGVEDAYPQVPLGVKVKGVTRQNLWVNPFTGTANGLTVVNNDDGSFSLSGEATAYAEKFSANVYTLKPNTKYSISKNADPGGYGFFVCFFDESGGSVDNFSTDTFTSPSDFAYVRFRFSANAERQLIPGTYRVMLNEGSEAEPWCPPGLNSVEGLEIWSAGKNLAGGISNRPNHNGINWTVDDDGFVNASGTATAANSNTFISYNAPYALDAVSFRGKQICVSYEASGSGSDKIKFNIRQYDEDGQTINAASANPLNGRIAYLTVADNASQVFWWVSLEDMEVGEQIDCHVKQYAGFEYPDGIEPPELRYATVNLSSNALRSLPDGTCDVLEIGEDGTASIEKAVGHAVYDGDENWSYVQNRIGLNNAAPGSVGLRAGYDMCDTLPVREVSATPAIMSYSGGYVDIRNDAVITDANTGKAWLAANPTRFDYKLATAQSVTLPAATLPALPGPTANVWAVATDGHGNTFTLQPQIELEYARDVTLVIGSLEAKVAALELLHETE